MSLADGLVSAGGRQRRTPPLSWVRDSLRRRLLGDHGITSLEMSILFPVILLVILLMFQISLYWHTANAVGVAAEQGLNAGQIYPDDLPRARTEAISTALNILRQSVNTPAPPQVVPGVSPDGNRLIVTVTARSPRLVPLGGWQVTSVAEGRFEEFVPASER